MLNKKQFILAFILIIFFAALLRLVGLTKLPPAPYWEEVALGYDAYSLLKTGKDHHGHSWPIVALESFGDYKPSGYFYALMPVIAVLGLNVEAVRLPSALAGIAMVAGMIVISQLLFFPDKKDKKSLWPLIAGLIMAISPWAIIFSRSAWEVNLATAMLLWAIILGIKTLRSKNLNYYWPHLLLLITTLYTYHSTRITAPLIGIWFLVNLLKQKIIKNKTQWIQLLLALSLTFLAALPMLLAMRQAEFRIRFAQTSAFNNSSLIEQSNAAKERLNNSLYARLVYHRYWFFLREMSTNFLSHFNLNFLFISGDINHRHSIQMMGQLYHIEIIFLFFGFVYLFGREKNNFNKFFLLFWLTAAILPASLTNATPHALRILPSLPVFILLIILGIKEFLNLIKPLNLNKLIRIFSIVLIVGLYLGEFTYFIHSYCKLYPQQYSQEWQFGYQEMLSALDNLKEQYPDLPIYMTREQGRPAMYYWFYQNTDPRLVQQAEASALKDQGEFLEFANIKFINGLNLAENKPAILVGSPAQIIQYQQSYPNRQLEIKQTIKDLKEEVIWQLAISN